MNKIEYHIKGTKVYCLFLNKIEEYIVEDIYINVNDKNPVSYTLKLTSNGNTTKLNHKDVFTSKKELKDFVVLQFEPKKEEVGDIQET